MKYLIVQDWENTKDNHAGMKHMCKLLAMQYPNEYRIFVKEIPRNWSFCQSKDLLSRIKNRFIRYKRNKYINNIYPNEYLKLCKPMFANLKDGDEVFLLEYLIPWASQYELAIYIRKYFPKVKIYALSHLTVNHFSQMTANAPNIIKKWALPIDKMLTLGSSLSAYFEKSGVLIDKISTGFHYVDSDYYQKKTNLCVQKPLTIITMGFLQRDYSILSEIVKGCPYVRWIICRGKKNIDALFSNLPNVELKGFLTEDELRHQMDIADISLNVMADTVGSNVITTSLAMGLGIVVSDVGSIRDYCDENNAVFCDNNAKSFISCINMLSQNPHKVNMMKQASMRKCQNLTITNINKWFSSL